MKTIKFLLKSLFSNAEVAIESKKQKWWLTFVVLILSLGLAILPNIISEAGKNGSQYITSFTQYNVDYSLERFSIEYLNGENAKLDLTINEDNKLVVGENDFSKQAGAKSVKVNEEDVYYISIKQNDNVTMHVAYIKSSDNFKTLENAIILNEKESVTEKNTTKYVSYARNTLFFAEDTVSLTIYQNNTLVELNETGTSIAKEPTYAATCSGVYTEISSQYKNLANLYNGTNPELIQQNWENFFNQAYSPLKLTTVLYSSIIYTGLNTMVLVIMAFTTFLMSRFKNALCEKLKFTEALQYVIYLALCPGLLSFLVYYMIPTLQAVSFFTFLALRSIFFTTKFTRGEFSVKKDAK